MHRERAGRHRRAVGTRPRRARAGALGSLLLLAALVLLTTSNAGAVRATPSARGDDRSHTSYALQSEAAVTVNASNPARSHRVAVAGALVALASLGGMLALGVAAARRRVSRARLEQFHVRRRGPPVLRIAH